MSKRILGHFIHGILYLIIHNNILQRHLQLINYGKQKLTFDTVYWSLLSLTHSLLQHTVIMFASMFEIHLKLKTKQLRI